MDISLPGDIKHMLFTKFFASRDGYSNLIKELESYNNNVVGAGLDG